MVLTNDEIKELRDLKTLADDDVIRYKNIIKQKLLDNKKIIYLLNNKELEDNDAEPDEYFGINILPYYMIEPSQTDVKNYLCYEVQFKDEANHNDFIKIIQVVFYILCHRKTNIEKNTYLCRHDLISSIILNQFNWSHCFGGRIHCISNIPNVVDKYFNSRILTFEAEIPNSVVKTQNRVTRVVNYRPDN